MKSLLFVFFTICSLITSSNYDDIDKGLELTFKAEYRKSAEIWENLLKKNGSIKVEFFCLFNKFYLPFISSFPCCVSVNALSN